MAKEISKSRIPNFPGLVLFCIDTSDSESRRNFQHFTRSTRLLHLCSLHRFSAFFNVIFQVFLEISGFCKILWIFSKSSIFRRKFHGILPELPEMTENCSKSVNFAEMKHRAPSPQKCRKFFRGKGKTEGMGKREIEIECQEKGNGRAPNLKSQPRLHRVDSVLGR